MESKQDTKLASEEQPKGEIHAATLRGIAVIAGLWFTACLVTGATGILATAPAFVVPAVMGSTTAVLAVALLASRGLKWFVGMQGLWKLVLLHAIRLPIGAAFVYYGSRGLLDDAFAMQAGWGDIGAGLLAVPAALLCLRPVSLLTKWLVLGWNIYALLDLINAVRTALSALVLDRPSMELMGYLPLAFVPLMIVPLLILTHILIFVRLLKHSGAGSGRSQT